MTNPGTMKAAVLEARGREGLKLRDFPRPVPAEGEAVLRVHAAGLNRVDLYMRDSGVGERKCPVYDNLQLIFCDIVHQPLYILIHAIGALLDWHRRSGRDRRQDSRKEREQETSRLNCSLVKPIHYRDGMRRIDVRSVSDTGSPHCISALPSRIGF